MKCILFLIGLLGAGLVLSNARAAQPAGAIIYRQFSFDPDSQAEIASYIRLEHYSTVDNVLTPEGRTVRIFSDEAPIYVPPPGDPNWTAAQAARVIPALERRFPQFASQLELIRRGWAVVPRAAPAVTPGVAIAAAAAAPRPTPESGNVLRTRYGETYRAWSVTGVEGNVVIITHADGISRISIADLPDDLTGFPPEVFLRAQALRQRAAADLRKEAARASARPAPSGAPPGPGMGR